jgi:hypothetical protein
MTEQDIKKAESIGRELSRLLQEFIPWIQGYDRVKISIHPKENVAYFVVSNEGEKETAIQINWEEP